jgi:hypothetical protein
MSTLFEYSDNEIDWYPIGVDVNGGFEGFIIEEPGGDNVKIGDEGWGILWDTYALPDGDYFVRATMTDMMGEEGSWITSVHIDRGPPIPETVHPLYGEAISGLYDFIATCSDVTDVVQMELLLFDEEYGGKGLIGRNGGGSGWFNQSGIGTTVQGPNQCAPTAAANALAGLNNSGLYPAGQAGNGSALRDALGGNMSTDANGTNAWRSTGGPNNEYETDDIGSGLEAYLRGRGLGCNNSDGYEVTVYRTKLQENASTGGWYPAAGSNEIDWDDYDSEIRKGEAVILDIRPWNPGADGTYGTEDDTTGGGHAVTGRGSNNNANPDGSHPVGINDPGDGQNHTTTWNSTGGFSRLEYPPGSSTYWLITGMWSVSPKNMTNVSCSSVGIDYVPEDGFSVSCDTTVVSDGTHVFIVEMTDMDGFIGSETIAVQIDNTPPVSTIDPPPGTPIYPYDPINIVADDYDGSGVYSINYEIWWDSDDDGIVDIQFGPFEEYDSNVEIILETFGIQYGYTEIWYFATDNAGNQEAEWISDYFVQDDIPPFSLIDPEGGIVSPDQSIWINATDDGSGIYSIYYEIWHEGTLVFDEEYLGSEVEIILASYGIEFGLVDIQWFSTDNAGNSEPIQTMPFDVEGGGDTTPPVSWIDPPGMMEPPGEPVDLFQPITITADDVGGSGVQYIHLEIWPDLQTEIIEDIYAESYVFDFGFYAILPGQTVRLEFYAVDFAGNPEDPETRYYDIIPQLQVKRPTLLSKTRDG